MTDWKKVQTRGFSTTNPNPKAAMARKLGILYNSAKTTAITKVRPRPSPFKNIGRHDITKSFNLSTTGASKTNDDSFTIPKDAILTRVLIDFPIGSRYNYFVRISIDGAPMFDDLRGNASVKEFPLSTPIKKGSVIKAMMSSDSTLGSSVPLKSFIDIILKSV